MAEFRKSGRGDDRVPDEAQTHALNVHEVEPPVPTFFNSDEAYNFGTGLLLLGMVLEATGLPSAFERSGALVVAFGVYSAFNTGYVASNYQDSKDLARHLQGLRMQVDQGQILYRALDSEHRSEQQTDCTDDGRRESVDLENLARSISEIEQDHSRTHRIWAHALGKALDVEGALVVAGTLVWGFGGLVPLRIVYPLFG